MKLTFGSLFSGIGGIDLGLERAGMECRWQVEIDPFCQQVLAKHWPEVTRYGDIKELTGGELERVDVMAGGFPCQGFSTAGKRRGTTDERWLWPDFRRLVGILRPRFVLVENVTGLIFTERGFGFHEVLAGLASIGYDAEWSAVSACALGAPHSRNRVFLLAYPQGDAVEDEGNEAARSLQPRAQFRGSRSGAGREWWVREPEIRRVAHGVPNGLVRDPLHALGNAVVPQVAEYIGLHIIRAAA